MGFQQVAPEQLRAYLDLLKSGQAQIKDPRQEAKRRLKALNKLRKLLPAQKALKELFEIAASDPDMGLERAPFHKQEQRTRELGARLNALGGFNLMSWACNQFEPNDRSNLDRIWDGVGHWRW
jgi:chromosome segregation ATPase